MKSISGKNFVKVLQKNGWEILRIRGSHYMLTHPDYRYTVSVPVHGNEDLKTGLLKQLMKQTGINEEDF